MTSDEVRNLTTVIEQAIEKLQEGIGLRAFAFRSQSGELWHLVPAATTAPSDDVTTEYERLRVKVLKSGNYNNVELEAFVCPADVDDPFEVVRETADKLREEACEQIRKIDNPVLVDWANEAAELADVLRASCTVPDILPELQLARPDTVYVNPGALLELLTHLSKRHDWGLTEPCEQLAHVRQVYEDRLELTATELGHGLARTLALPLEEPTDLIDDAGEFTPDNDAPATPPPGDDDIPF